MELLITANGTTAFFLPAGSYRVDVGGTLGGSTVLALKAGASSDGSDHVAVTSDGTTAVTYATGAIPEPFILEGGGYFSVVTTDFSGSSGLSMTFRKAASA